jgi:hypothetical protein
MQTNPLSDVSSRKKRERIPKVSFARDIRPLFRAVDISHMKSYGVKLDDYTFMSNPDNANKVLRTLSPHGGHPPSMPLHVLDAGHFALDTAADEIAALVVGFLNSSR